VSWIRHPRRGVPGLPPARQDRPGRRGPGDLVTTAFSAFADPTHVRQYRGRRPGGQPVGWRSGESTPRRPAFLRTAGAAVRASTVLPPPSC